MSVFHLSCLFGNIICGTPQSTLPVTMMIDILPDPKIKWTWNRHSHGRGIPWHPVAYCGTRRIFQGTVGTEASCSWRRWASEAPCPVLLPWGLTRELSIKASMYSNHQKDPKKFTAMSVGFDMFFLGDCYTDEWLLHMIGLDYRKDRGALMKPKLEVFWSEHDQNITKPNGSSWFIIMFIHISLSYLSYSHAISSPFPFFTEVVAAPGRKGSSEPWHLHHRSCACPTKAPLGDRLPWGCGGFDKVEPTWRK